MSNILVVDDEAGIRELLKEILHDEGHQVWLAESAQEARTLRAESQPDLVLLDIWMPDTDGITLLKEWAASGQLTMPVVMMSGHGTIDTAVEATRIGAYDFLEKPIALQKLLNTVSRALKRAEQASVPEGLAALGSGPVVEALRSRLLAVRAAREPVLLLGEPGCGFEHVARFLHKAGTPWFAPEDSGWLTDRPLETLQAVRGGLLYLHEVGRLSRLEQKGLLLVLPKLARLDIRLVASSHGALRGAGGFDEALWHELSAITVVVPPLREHREDIPELARALLAQMVDERSTPPRRLSSAALEALSRYNWPGNLRELANVVRSAALAASGEEITAEDIAPLTASSLQTGALPLDLDKPLREARDAFEKLYFEHHIAKAGGNMSRVAEMVGLERTHLYRKLKQLDVRIPRKPD
jgi:DNA-binding NtrC family response regulator